MMTCQSQGITATFERLHAAILLCDGNGIVRHLNTAGTQLLHANHAENVIGRSVTDFVDPDFADLMAEGLDVFVAELEGVPLKLMAVDGKLIDIILYVSRYENFVGEADIHYLIECRDISRFINASESARWREQRLNAVLNAVDQAVISIDQFGQITDFNEAAEKIFQHRRAEAIGKNISLLMPAPHRDRHDQYLHNYFASGDAKFIGRLNEFECVRADGEVFPAEITVSEQADKDDHPSFIGIIRDITLKKRQEERIRFLALHDALTELPNRYAFTERLERALSRASRGDQLAALMYIDLDNFKPVNDRLGHEAGDHVLKSIAQRLLGTIRKTDFAARIGGDEFVVVLENIEKRADIETVAQGILKSLKSPIAFEGHACGVGASIGIAVYPDDAEDRDALTRAADEVMYRVKQSGRNDYRFA